VPEQEAESGALVLRQLLRHLLAGLIFSESRAVGERHSRGEGVADLVESRRQEENERGGGSHGEEDRVETDDRLERVLPSPTECLHKTQRLHESCHSPTQTLSASFLWEVSRRLERT
jgi:hypothetical protein